MHTPWWHHLGALYNLLHPVLPYLVGGGGILGGQSLAQKLRQRRAAGWPSADGEVQHANVELEKKNGYTVVLEYRYYARSQYHYGKYSRRFRRKKQADEFADALWGRHIQVRYQEDKPEVSVVLDEDLKTTGVFQLG